MSDQVVKEIGKMTDAELASVISGAPSPDNPDTSTPEVPTAEAPVAEAPNPETPPVAQPESAPADQPVTQPPADPILAKLEAMEKRFAELEAQNTKLAEEKKNLQILAGNQGNELGVLRKQAQALPKPVLPTDTELLENPVEGTKKVVAALEQEKANREIERQNAEIARKNAMAQTVLSYVPIEEFKAALPDMIEILKMDKQPPEVLRDFAADPLSLSNDPGTLVGLAKRALALKELKSRDSKIADLEKQIAELKKAPAAMAGNLKDAANAAPTVSSQSVKPAAKKPTSTPNLQKMSDAEIAKLIEENKAKLEE